VVSGKEEAVSIVPPILRKKEEHKKSASLFNFRNSYPKVNRRKFKILLRSSAEFPLFLAELEFKCSHIAKMGIISGSLQIKMEEEKDVLS